MNTDKVFRTVCGMSLAYKKSVAVVIISCFQNLRSWESRRSPPLKCNEVTNLIALVPDESARHHALITGASDCCPRGGGWGYW